jgi:hypothetical protein
MRIAMRCSQEQFDAIKDRLTNFDLITNFDKSSYLINCYRESSITNLTYEYANAWADEFYEEWNEEIFLKACGIETEKTFKGSELQYKSILNGDWVNCKSDTEYRLKSTKKQELENQILELQNQLKNL